MLLKGSRRGHYGASATNADTFWRSVWARCPEGATLPGRFPPTSYYWWGLLWAHRALPGRDLGGGGAQKMQAVWQARCWQVSRVDV